MNSVLAPVTPSSRSTASRLTASRLTASRLTASRLTASRLTASRLTSSMYSSNLDRSWPPSASPNSPDHGHQVHLQICTIMASKCISEFTRSRPQSVSPILLHHGLQVHTSWSPSVCPKSLDYDLQVLFWVHSITPSQCTSKLARSRP